MPRLEESFVFTIESVISDVTLSHNGCEEHDDGLVMIDSGASVNVCPKFLGNLSCSSLTVRFD